MSAATAPTRCVPAPRSTNAPAAGAWLCRAHSVRMIAEHVACEAVILRDISPDDEAQCRTDGLARSGILWGSNPAPCLALVAIAPLPTIEMSSASGPLRLQCTLHQLEHLPLPLRTHPLVPPLSLVSSSLMKKIELLTNILDTIVLNLAAIGSHVASRRRTLRLTQSELAGRPESVGRRWTHWRMAPPVGLGIPKSPIFWLRSG